MAHQVGLPLLQATLTWKRVKNRNKTRTICTSCSRLIFPPINGPNVSIFERFPSWGGFPLPHVIFSCLRTSNLHALMKPRQCDLSLHVIVKVASSKIKVHARGGTYCPITYAWAHYLRHDTYCPISAEIRTVDSQSDLRILF